MKYSTLKIALIAVPILLAGCASSQKIQIVQAGDQKLSCDDIKQQLEEVDAVTSANEKNKGATGKNVAAAIFFWPALAYTYIDARDAEKLALDRKNHLTKIYNDKNCG